MPKAKQKPKAKPKQKVSDKKEQPKQGTKTTVPSAYKLFRDALLILRKQWKTVAVILLIYFLLTVLFASGVVSASTINQLKSNISSSAHGGASSVNTGVSIFGSLIGSTLATSVSTGDGQTLLFLIFSLIIIWLLRQLYLGHNPKARDALYGSLAPLISFFLITLLLCAELLPASLGAYIYTLAFTNGVVVGGFEKVVWLIVLIALILASIYLFVSSLFALYIVTLPDMRPMKALRSSWGIVKKRRLLFCRKMLFIPIVLILTIAVITVFFIIIIPPIAGWIFLLLTIASVAIGHSYMYALYRESL